MRSHNMVWTLIYLVFFALRLPLFAQQQLAPQIFFTDLESGPNTGGQDNLGAFISIYGEGLGPSRGSSTVTIGGREVARYVLWGQDNAGARNLDLIVVQPGPGVTSGNIVVTIGGRSSNSLPFTVRPGGIYFVSTSGDDSNDGSFARPWRTIAKAKNTIAAGDIAYIRDGVIETREEIYGAVLSIETGGTNSAPKALIAYPGAAVTVGSTSLEFGIRIPNNQGTVANDWVIAKLVLRGQVSSVEMGGDGSSRWRVVGNDISCPVGDGQTGCFAAALASNIAFLGNNVHDISRQGPQPSKQYHAVYFTTDTNHVEVGWNHIHDNNTCRAIQFHSSPLEGNTGYNQYDLCVHDNLIYGDVCDGIVFATVDPSKGPVRVFNNIIFDVGLGPPPPDGDANYSGIYVAGGTNTGPDGTGTVEIFNNTLYNCGARKLLPNAIGDEGAFSRGPDSPGLIMSLKNNIVYAVNGEDYIAPSSTTSLINGSNNLWFGGSTTPAFMTGNLSSDPLFVDAAARDFRLKAGSPAIDAGSATGTNRDYLGNGRPQGRAYDLGAHEFQQQAATARSLYYPRLVTTNGSPASFDNSEYTGIAVANLSNSTATLTFTALNRSGTALTGAGITNPSSVTLNAGQQLPIVDSQLFGAGLPNSAPMGWVRVDSTVREVAGFFLMFNGSLSVLDGADVSSDTVASFVFTDIENPGYTQIHIANPNQEPAVLTLEVYTFEGTLRAPTLSRTISPNGVLAESLSNLFPGVFVRDSDYIRVTSDKGVVPFELLGQSGQYVRGLRGQDLTSGATALYCPQYVAGGSIWRTTVKIINLDATDATIRVRLIGDDGTQIGSDWIGGIPGRGTISMMGSTLFGNSASIQAQGYLQIVSSGPRLMGSVAFGDINQKTFSTALPLVSNLQKAIVFSHVASDAIYYTGLAIVNPNSTAAAATIDVFDSNGNRIASKVENIPAGRRKSQLLTQYFPDLVGQDRTSGYIHVTSDQRVASFALFGTNTGSVLSAIPPQVVP